MITDTTLHGLIVFKELATPLWYSEHQNIITHSEERGMGLGGISIWQLLIVLAIVILLFGTKRLRSFGSDLGNSVKGFRKAMDTQNKEEEKDKDKDSSKPQALEGSDDIANKTHHKSNAEQKEKQD